MKSLNQIIAELEDFATSHWQIHTFGHGDVWEISPQSSGIVYPVLWMVPQTATPTLNEVVDEFTVLCMDLVDSGERNETEVLSDTRQIILDVCAYYRQTHTNDYIIEFGSSIQPFTERDPERVSGHSLTIRIKQPHDYNLCAVPANAVPVPPIPSCADATVQNAASNPTYQASVASGGVLVLPQIKVLDSDGITPILANYIPNTSGYAVTCTPPTCADATVTVNTAPFDTAPSGGALNVPVINGGSNPVGSKQGIDWVIDNNATFINATQVTDQEAEVDANIFVTLDGTQSGTWNAGLQTWEVTGAACADANLEINGVQQETIASGGTFNLIATLDGVAGGTYDTGTNTLSFTSNTGWVRNPDWLPMPTVGAEEFVMLLAVFEDRTNKLTMTVSGVALVDYGDGTTVNSNGLAQLHTYDYTTLAGSVFVDPISGQNYKQVLVKVTRIAANITAITFTGGPVFALDIEATLPNVTNLNLVLSNLPLYLCERIVINSISASYNTLDRLANGSNRLRVITFPWGTPTSLGGVVSFTSCPIDDLGDVTSSSSTFTSLFGASQIVKAGTITNNTATSWSFLFDQSALLQEITGISSTSMTTGIVTFRNCSKLRGTVTVNCPALSNADSMFQNDAQLDGLIFTNASAMVTTTNLVNGCRMLGNLVMNGLTRGINLTTTNLGNFGMSNFANSIGTASGAQTITVTGTPYGQLLTALDATALAIRLVITGKGYTVVN